MPSRVPIPTTSDLGQPSVTVGALRIEHLIRLGELGSRVRGSSDLGPVLDEALAAVIDIAGARGGRVEVGGGNGATLSRAIGKRALAAEPYEMIGLDGERVGTLTLYFDSVTARPDNVRMVEAYVRRLAEIVERTRLSGDKHSLLASERRRSEQLRELAEAALALTTAPSVREILRRAAESAQAIIGTHQAVASRLTRGWEAAESFVSLSDEYAAHRADVRTPRALGLANVVTRKNRPLRLTAAQLAGHPDLGELRDPSDRLPLPDYLAAPFVGRESRNLGLLQLSDKVDGTAFSREDEALLVQLAQMASAALESSEALERERTAREEAERTSRDLFVGLEQRQRYERVLAGQAEIFEAIAKGLSLEIVLELIVRTIEALFPDAKASIELLEDDRLVNGPAPSLPAFYRSAMNGMAAGPVAPPPGAAAHARATVISHDVARDRRWDSLRDLAEQAGIRACWSVPIEAGSGDVLGVVTVYHQEARTPSVQHQAVVGVFARAAAVAIERSRDAAQLVHEQLVVSTLNEVGRAIGTQLDVAEIVQQVTDAATKLTRAQFGAFFYNVYDDNGEAYMLYALSGAAREAFEGFPMPRNTAIFDPTFRGERTVVLDDVTADPRYGQNPPHRGMPEGHLPVRSYLAVPVKTVAGEVVGGLFFGHEKRGVFGTEATRVAEGIAAHAAIAIQNARLYETARRESEATRKAFEDRDRVAKVLQSSLLPPHLPDIPGTRVAGRFLPGAADVGGDFYDLFPVRGRDWGLVIGDVCGKGADAAALTALARHSIRTAAMLERQPSSVLAIMNEALLRGGSDGRFATAAYARLSPSARGAKVVVGSGGHPPVAVLRSWGDVMFLQGRGTLLGVFEDPGVEDQIVELGPGDSLVMYTDGVTEARRGDELFGEARLIATLRSCRGMSADEIAGAIESAVAGFRSDDTGDDIAILAVTIDS